MATRFEDHTVQMKIFHKTHATIGLVAAPRCDQIITLNSLWSLYIGNHISASGGTSVPVDRAGWLGLVPLWKITGERFLPN